MTPLSRRLLLTTNIPFVLRNSASSGLPIISPSGLTMPTTKDHTTFGDISFTPRFLLHETKDLSFTAEVVALVPTGNQPLAGKTALTPAFAFWNNFAGRWVIRGRIGDDIPLGGGGSDTLISELAIGQTLTDHDVPLFGDFTWYIASVVNTPLRDGQLTSVTLTPGHTYARGPRLVFLGRSTDAVDQSASRRHRYDLLVHESVVKGQSSMRLVGRFLLVSCLVIAMDLRNWPPISDREFGSRLFV